ncbi:hypothetical protein F2Q69_00010835 [Brassica cretica]|uniref:Hs1pro-1 C-terminal domain-containing protein n=1 Tax=Brassica cretica TaxID=69181 RepID=A0A8S9QMP0_BRACR|nr:hypothetical protein F2Q69_00010835 [Brassica cretica]
MSGRRKSNDSKSIIASRIVCASTRSVSENRTSLGNLVSNTTPFADRTSYTASRIILTRIISITTRTRRLYILHQIIESWLHVSLNLLRRINTRVDEGRFGEASGDVYLVESIWKLLTDVEDLHLLMDPEDFLKLKKHLHIKTGR